MSNIISKIFNLSYETGVVPLSWKLANITPLYKKGSRLDPANYRPISITSTLCKLMEKQIRDFMLAHLMKHKLLDENQHGFVLSKSCATNLIETLDIITFAFSIKSCLG